MAGVPVTGTTTVAEVLDRWPEALSVFLRHGFAPLADPSLRRTLTPTVTITQACQMRVVDVDVLLRELNALVQHDQATSPRGPAPAGAVREEITSALRDCFDPEVGINIVDLGMVESVRAEDGTVHVRLLLTSPWCPQTEALEEQVRRRLLGVPGVSQVIVDFSDAPWSPDRMSEAARKELGIA